MTRRLEKGGRQARPREIAGIFWLPEPLTPSAAWDLITALRTGGPTFAPAWFRAGGMPAPRMLRRKSEPLAVEALSSGEEIELLRRAGAEPRAILRSEAAGDRQRIRLWGQPLGSLADALSLIRLISDLCNVLRPVAGVVDERESSGPDHALPRALAEGLPREGIAESWPDAGWHGFPGWVTVLGPGRVDAIGASRLLMAPVFLIDPLTDGGLLIAATPLPRDAEAGAGRRSTARSPHPQWQGWWPGVPLLESEELLTPR